MRARRKDGNHGDIKMALEALGASVCDVYQLPGVLDVIVGYQGIDVRCEIKDPSQPPSKRRLTDLEQGVFDAWKGHPPVVLETFEDCEQLLKHMTIRREMMEHAL
jgi:hypothetical protein